MKIAGLRQRESLEAHIGCQAVHAVHITVSIM
jgi:hypothetical protein